MYICGNLLKKQLFRGWLIVQQLHTTVSYNLNISQEFSIPLGILYNTMHKESAAEYSCIYCSLLKDPALKIIIVSITQQKFTQLMKFIVHKISIIAAHVHLGSTHFKMVGPNSTRYTEAICKSGSN